MRRGGDNTAFHKAYARPRRIHDTEADRRNAGVNAQNTHVHTSLFILHHIILPYFIASGNKKLRQNLCRSFLLSGSGMSLVIHILELLFYELGINLRRGYIGVAEHFLYRVDIRSVFEQVRSKGMTQRVRRCPWLSSLSSDNA